MTDAWRFDSNGWRRPCEVRRERLHVCGYVRAIAIQDKIRRVLLNVTCRIQS